MSDLCIYELDDIAWDEICQSDDHIVPQPGDKQGNENAFPRNSHKKPRREVIGVSSNRRDTMLEKNSWAQRPECVFPASCDGDPTKEATSLVSDNSRMASHCFKSSNIDSLGSEFHPGDPTISDRCVTVDNNSYDYSLDHISQADNSLSFFDGDCKDKESSDLLFYGWPDMENYEDVDRMFRSCDSTFGLTGVGNEEELGWFSSTNTIEGSEDILKSDFKFSFESSPSKNLEECEPSKLNNASSSINGSNMESASVSYKCSSRTSEDDEPDAVGHVSFANASDTISESKDECTPKEQNNQQKEQAKHKNQSEAKRKGRCLENGSPYHHIPNLLSKDSKLPSGNSSQQVFLSQQMQNRGPDSFGYLQTHIPYMYSGHDHPSDHISVSPTLSVIHSENDGLTSVSTKESSYASNQMQSMESSHGHSFEAPAITTDKKRERLNLQQGFQPSFTSNQHRDMLVQAASKPVQVPKRVICSKNEVDNDSEVEAGSLGVPAEGSCTSTGLDEISLEATSFRQLQRVMEQLDIRTKLCIRDSLYRLARSAEKRHHNANLNRDTSGALMDEGTAKCSGFMDIETDTNPIDRSIAHLLFHRPSDSSVSPAYDASSLKSRTMIHGSNASPPVMTEKLVGQEETATKVDKKGC